MTAQEAIEMIMEVTRRGTDVNDSEKGGVLVRCIDCEQYWKAHGVCTKSEMNRGRGTAFSVDKDFYCGYGLRRVE